MTRLRRIQNILTKALTPTKLEIVDESVLHAGHNPAASLGETHYCVTIVSPVFIGKTRVEQHRLINDLLADEFKTGLHALTIIIPHEKQL